MEKMSRKELKSPDRIWVASRDLLSWASDQWALLVGLAAVIFVAVIAVTLVLQYRTKNEAEAQFVYSKAKALYEQTQMAPAKDQPSLKKDLETELGKLQEDYASSRANGMASLIRAQILLGENKLPEAITELEKYQKSLPRNEREFGSFPLAVAYEQAGKFDEALKTFDEIATNEKASLRGDALIGKGRVLVQLKRGDEAKKSFNLYLEKFPQSSEAATVRGLIAEIK